MGPTQGLEHRLRSEKMHSINFTEHNKRLVELALYWSK